MAAPRSMESAAISFGLVTVPVRLYPAVRSSAGLSFHLLHETDNSRLKQQYVCAKDGEVVPRSEMIKGYEYAKDRYVTLTDEELKALDEKATQGIEITEFVPADSVDPVYFERPYYLGPGKGGEKAYALLVKAMEDAGVCAVARRAARGKDYLVLLRPVDRRLVMEQLYHSDEVRPLGEIPVDTPAVRENELKLAQQLIEQITSERFQPEKYEDEVRKRIEKLIAKKVEGEDIVSAPEERPRAQVVDLMEALKASLAQGKGGRSEPRRGPQRVQRTAARAARRPTAVAAGRKK
jgi:DNA end-binding protein Ku